LSGIKAKVSGVGMYVPKKVLTNHDLSGLVDTSDQWIRERTGISERRFVSEGESNSDLSVGSIKEVLVKTGHEPEDIDVIIVATVTPDMIFPSTACVIQEKIGASNAWGFDLSAACSGFLYALSTGVQFIETGAYKRVLVVGTDVMSSIINFKDRSTCVLFGDGSGTILLEPSTDEAGVLDFLLRSDGSGGQHLCMPAGGSQRPATHETVSEELHYVQQSGRAVFRYAVKLMTGVCREILERNGLTPEDVQLFVPHQANSRIIDSSVDRLGLSPEQVLINIDRYANTTAATIPMGLAEAEAEGRLKSGDLVLLASFGAGFTWGSVLIRW